jgi:hypothetical protein
MAHGRSRVECPQSTPRLSYMTISPSIGHADPCYGGSNERQSGEMGPPPLTSIGPQSHSPQEVTNTTAIDPLGLKAAVNSVCPDVEQVTSIARWLRAARAQDADQQPTQRLLTDNTERIVFEFYLKHIGPWVSNLRSSRVIERSLI